jgi:hypothetical protein
MVEWNGGINEQTTETERERERESERGREGEREGERGRILYFNRTRTLTPRSLRP